MKLQSLLATFALSISIYAGIISAETPQTSPDTNEYIEHIDDKRLNATQKALTTIGNNLLQLDQIAEELAMRISNNQIKQIKNKKETIGILSQLREVIHAFQENTTEYLMIMTILVNKEADIPQQHRAMFFSTITSFIFNAQRMSEGIAVYLDDAVKTTLKNIKAFDPALYSTKGNRLDTQQLTAKELTTTFHSTTKTIESINSNINSIGLTWYNKTARSVNRNIIEPIHNYHVPTIAGLSIATMTLAALVTWKYGHLFDQSDAANSISKNMADACRSLRSWLGDPKPLENGYQMLQSESSNTINMFDKNSHSSNTNGGILPAIDHGLAQLLSNRDPLIMLGGGALFAYYTSILTHNIKPWFDIKINKTWNFLLGGTYEDNFIKGYWDYTPHVTFDNMIGLDYVKEELKQILYYLEDPEKMTTKALEAEKGWLLTGKSRAGKSFSIECLCGEIEKRMSGKYKFWKLDAASVKYFGIKTIFEMAKEAAPVILYIDEIHLLLENPTDDATRTLLHDFLNTMQSTLEGNKDSSKPIILFTATNKEWLLPDAVRSNGRLGKEIRIEFPNLEERKNYIIYELCKKAANPRNFNIEALALKTNDKSFEDIRAIIRHATTKALIQNIPLTHEMLEDSLNSEIRDILLDDRKDLPLYEKEILASHFAGRALSVTLLNTNIKLDTVTIKGLKTDTKNNYDPQSQAPSITYGNLITKSLHDTIKMHSRDDIIGEIKTLLAGFTAEELLLGSCSYKCHPEYRAKAYDLVKNLVFEGIDPNTLSTKVRDQKLDEAYEMLENYKHEVTQLLQNNRKLLEVITSCLIEKGILTDAEINYLIHLINEQEKNQQTMESDNIDQTAEISTTAA